MSTSARAASRRTCPECGSVVPEMDCLRHWCDRCNWNVAAPRQVEEPSFLVRRYVAIGESRGRKMLAALMAAPVEELRPRFTPEKAAAFAIAVAVHLISLGLLVAGVTLAIMSFRDLRLLAAGAVCCGLGFLLFPRMWPIPKQTLSEADCPALFAFVREITSKLGGKPVRHIVVEEEFNASYSTVGWRREPVLHIGLPLWIALRPQERVAVVAHEIAHGVNGDSTRGFVVGSAASALDELTGLLRPSHCATSASESLARYLTWVLSLPLVALQGVLIHLLWQEKQRAEYFADYLATTLSGTSAQLNALTRVALGEHLDDVLLRHAYSTSQSGAYILGLFRQRIEALPEGEWDRIRRASEAEGARLDSTHPPTAFRRAFLEAHPVTEPAIIADDARMAAIDAELRKLEERLGRKLIARFARD